MKPKSGYCINCDNKHGCKTKTPPCVDAMMAQGITDRSGKDYLLQNQQTALCKECPFFRSCWRSGEYDRLGK